MKRFFKTTINPFTKSHLVAMLAILAAVFVFTGCSEEPLMGPADQSQTGTDIQTVQDDKNLVNPIQPVPVPPRRNLAKDSDLNGTVLPQLDDDGGIIGWDVAITGLHYETPVNYAGNIVGGQFTPALPGLGWLHDDAEMLPAFEFAFVNFSNDPYALTHQGEGGGAIDAPIGGSWGKALAMGPGNIDYSDLLPCRFDLADLDRDETFSDITSSTLRVTVHDPATGEALTGKEAGALLVSKGLPMDRVEAFLAGEATDEDFATMADKDGVQVTVGAEVSITVKVPPFVEVTVTGSVSLTGDMDDYADLAREARRLARELAEDLAEEVKESLKKLKELVKWIVDQIDDMLDDAWWWPF